MTFVGRNFSKRNLSTAGLIQAELCRKALHPVPSRLTTPKAPSVGLLVVWQGGGGHHLLIVSKLMYRQHLVAHTFPRLTYVIGDLCKPNLSMGRYVALCLLISPICFLIFPYVSLCLMQAPAKMAPYWTIYGELEAVLTYVGKF